MTVINLATHTFYLSDVMLSLYINSITLSEPSLISYLKVSLIE